MIEFSDTQISELREKIRFRLSEKRYLHTLSVEKMAKTLAEFFDGISKSELSAAALLHDIAKEYPIDEILEFIRLDGLFISQSDRLSESILHSYAAPFVIKKDFSEFATDNVLSACKNHTVGAPNMSLFDKIIFISDYIEEGRKNISSKAVRETLLSSLSVENDTAVNIKALNSAVVCSIDYTISYLDDLGKPINEKMLLTKTDILGKI